MGLACDGLTGDREPRAVTRGVAHVRRHRQAPLASAGAGQANRPVVPVDVWHRVCRNLSSAQAQSSER